MGINYQKRLDQQLNNKVLFELIPLSRVERA